MKKKGPCNFSPASIDHGQTFEKFLDFCSATQGNVSQGVHCIGQTSFQYGQSAKGITRGIRNIQSYSHKSYSHLRMEEKVSQNEYSRLFVIWRHRKRILISERIHII